MEGSKLKHSQSAVDVTWCLSQVYFLLNIWRTISHLTDSHWLIYLLYKYIVQCFTHSYLIENGTSMLYWGAQESQDNISETYFA